MGVREYLSENNQQIDTWNKKEKHKQVDIMYYVYSHVLDSHIF